MLIINIRTMTDTIELGHGGGGLMSRKLIRSIFMKYFDNEWLNCEGDSAVVKSSGSHIAFTTDSYVIDPLFFPGGDLGKLAVCGTVNDLAVTGAKPACLTAGFILEEGISFNILENIAESMKAAADKAGVNIVAGDTKVVGKGQADRIFINTSGIGFVNDKHKDIVSGKMIEEGDVLIVNGTLGDHEATIINARENFFEDSGLKSDCASLNGIIKDLLDECHTLHFMRDITRGGLAGILSEIADISDKGIEINEVDIPFNESVTAFCEALGYDPLHMANEGKFVIVLSAGEADKAMRILKKHEEGINVSRIGRITIDHPGKVVMNTLVGGRRLVEPPWTVKVPRIC